MEVRSGKVIGWKVLMRLSLFCAAMAALLILSVEPALQVQPKPVNAEISIQTQAHATTFRIAVPAHPLTDDGFTCSATAVGPYALMTATHCDRAEEEFLVGSKTVKVLGKMQDHEDHTVYLTDTAFPTWSTLSNRLLVQGEHVFMFGNPARLIDIYREGYVSGVMAGNTNLFPDFRDHGKVITLYDLNGYKGDSGVALFDSNGQIVGVLSVFEVISDEDDPFWNFRLAGSFPLSFSSEEQGEFMRWKPGNPIPGAK